LDDLEFSPRSEAIFQREVRKAVAAGAVVNEALVRSILTQHFEISYDSEDEEGVEECHSVVDVEEKVFTFEGLFDEEKEVECKCKNAPHFGNCDNAIETIQLVHNECDYREIVLNKIDSKSCLPKSSVCRPPALELEFSNTIFCPETPQMPPSKNVFRRPQRAMRSISPPVAVGCE
jgi:hypothetical protein